MISTALEPLFLGPTMPTFQQFCSQVVLMTLRLTRRMCFYTLEIPAFLFV